MKRVDEKVADLMAANALKEGRAGGEEGGRQSSSINNGLKRLAQVGYLDARLRTFDRSKSHGQTDPATYHNQLAIHSSPVSSDPAAG